MKFLNLHRLSFPFLLFVQFIIITITFKVALGDNKEGLPFCEVTDYNQRIVLVSTLDGKMTALNPSDKGEPLWSIHPGHEPMLSSSIHRLELTNLGQLVRMIPSLNGGLYKFNGENVEPIPLTADHLLRASFRYSDDLVISGGKESQTMGISLQTGEIIYECSMKGCKEDGRFLGGDVIIVQRMGQVVRAVEPRSGAERWNFSVAQHDVKLVSQCHTPERLQLLNLKVIVPEGLVCAMDEFDSILWQHKFDSPIVSAWEVTKGNVFEVDLFSRFSHYNNMSPSIYIGMHDKQLYIQESVSMVERRKQLTSSLGKSLISHESSAPRLPWRPVLANGHSLGLSVDGKKDESMELDESHEEGSTTALSVLYASPYVDGMGFYLFTKEDIQQVEQGLCNITIQEEDEDNEGVADEETPVTIVIVSLWYWWREVAVISITTAILFNLFTRGFFYFRREETLLPLTGHKASGNTSDSGIIVEKQAQNSESPSIEYVSRYLTDFDPVHCLGKGGFGVVFEAKNKIDDCHYAIKRIVLPDAPESRERVMREVRALAKLDHHNIVRYFNSWMECPPPGWQRDQDRQFICDGDSVQDEMLSETATSCYPTPSKALLTNERKPYDCDKSDSFIVFASDSNCGDNSQEPLVASSRGEELSIRIDTTNSEKEGKNRRKRTKSIPWADLNSICLSPSKVYLYIQMQLCRRESLKDWMLTNPNRDYQTSVTIFEQIVKAVEYVHLNNLIHRDLKPSNIFFSMDHQIKVGDFGLVTSIADEAGRHSPNAAELHKWHTSQVGTQLYMSPEQLSGLPYSFKVDIFSLGLILLELLVPFSTEMERQKILKSARTFEFPKKFIDNYKVEHDLLKKMLSHDPDKRPTTIDILNEPPLFKEGMGDTGTGLSDVRRHRRESSRTSVSSGNSSEFSYEMK